VPTLLYAIFYVETALLKTGTYASFYYMEPCLVWCTHPFGLRGGLVTLALQICCDGSNDITVVAIEMTCLMSLQSKYHMEENFGGKTLWTLLQSHQNELCKWTLLQKKTKCLHHQEPTRWRRGTIKTCTVQVETSVNLSAKWLYITISEMDTPFGGTQMQSIQE